jgi:hypothetical protein
MEEKPKVWDRDIIKENIENIKKVKPIWRSSIKHTELVLPKRPNIFKRTTEISTWAPEVKLNPESKSRDNRLNRTLDLEDRSLSSSISRYDVYHPKNQELYERFLY